MTVEFLTRDAGFAANSSPGTRVPSGRARAGSATGCQTTRYRQPATVDSARRTPRAVERAGSTSASASEPTPRSAASAVRSACSRPFQNSSSAGSAVVGVFSASSDQYQVRWNR